jgi:phosphoribosylformylglycinamidine synthase
VLEVAAAAGVPVARLGRTGGETLTVEGLFTVPLAELRSVHEATLPALFG